MQIIPFPLLRSFPETQRLDFRNIEYSESWRVLMDLNIFYINRALKQQQLNNHIYTMS